MKFNIKIEKALAVARANLAQHIKELKDAQDVWIDDVHDALTALKDAVNRDGLKASEDALHKLFWGKPRDSRKEYARIIGALERALESGQSTVEMDEADYDAVFNDNWDWRQQSKLANQSYSSRKR